MTLIDGKAISEQVKQEIAAEVAEIVAQGGKRPPPGSYPCGTRRWQRNLCSRQSKSLRSLWVQIFPHPLRKRRDRRRTARQST